MGRNWAAVVSLLGFAVGALAQVQVASVMNAADSTPVVAPGSIATISGTGLAPSAAAASGFPLPTKLNGVTVEVNLKPAPLFYVSPTQITFQIPHSTTGTGASVLIMTGAGVGIGQVAVAAQYPGIFRYGAGHGVIQNQDNSMNSPTNPAASGSFVIVYLTGLGVTTPPVADGALAPSAPRSAFTGTAKATIGDSDAPIRFLGLTPGSAGVGQAEIEVPPMPAGDYPLYLSLNGYQYVSAVVSVSGPSGGFQATKLLTPMSSFFVPGVGTTTVATISGLVANSAALYRNTLYLCSPSDIKVVDVTNPASPVFLSKISDSGLAGSAHNCTVDSSGAKPFLADIVRNSQSIAVYDLSNPTAPAKKSQNSVSIVPRSVAYSGSTGFFGENLFSYSGHEVTFTSGNILSVDFSNLSAPVAGPLVVSSAAQAETNKTNLRPYMLVPAPGLLYAASTTASGTFNSGVGALDLFDISNPKSIHGAGQLLVPGSKMLLTLAVQGSEMLAVGDTRGYSPGNVLPTGVDFPFAGYLTLTMFDISNPGQPKMQGNVIVQSMQPGNVGGPDSLGTVSLGGGFFAVTCAPPDLNATGGGANGSLVIVDARDPQNPQAHTYGTLFGLGGLTVADGYLYAATASGASVYRIQLP